MSRLANKVAPIMGCTLRGNIGGTCYAYFSATRLPQIVVNAAGA